MSDENRAYVDKIMVDGLRKGLATYVLDEYKNHYGNSRYLKEMVDVLRKQNAYHHRRPITHPNQARKKFDVAAWLKIMLWSWDRVFQKLENKEETYAKELLYANELLKERNRKAHENGENGFTNDDVLRVADTATRLLETIGAKEEAKVTREIKQEYGQLIFTGEKREFALVGDAPQSSTDSNGRSPGKNEEDQIQGVGNEFKQSGDSSSDNSTEQATAGKVGGLERTSHTDDAIQQLIRQHQYQHQEMMQQLQTSASAANVSQPVININPTISPNVGDQVTYAPSAQTTVIAERNNAAFVVGVLGGLFGLLGIAHIFNHKVGRGLVYLFVGTVCYWIFLLFLFSALINIGSSLWIAAVAIHLVIIWQHAKRGAGNASANQTREPKRK